MSFIESRVMRKIEAKNSVIYYISAIWNWFFAEILLNIILQARFDRPLCTLNLLFKFMNNASIPLFVLGG